jgi:hypothetical protein
MAVFQFQAYNAESITPSDTNNITTGGVTIQGLDSGVCLYVGVGGDVQVTMIGGQVVLFENVADGSFLPIQVNKVWQSNTNASSILALY